VFLQRERGQRLRFAAQVASGGHFLTLWLEWPPGLDSTNGTLVETGSGCSAVALEAVRFVVLLVAQLRPVKSAKFVFVAADLPSNRP
jgi:hypothetical protein